ncbi:MAG TPA: hybrid sensor histidine kinase/response regulator [Labilithrix sp.]|nr:hybrid sensor histidine kinase/response regulator [Labilithrix sp.]
MEGPEHPSVTVTVLVVDDNEANRSLARDALEDEGYRVVLASGGAEAIAAFEAERPGCILLDVRMPGLDGFAVCERIRALPGGAEVPVVFLTAQRDVETFERALRSGGDDFLTKPVRPAELVLRVQAALRLRQTRDELRDHYDLLKREREHHLRVQLQKERLSAFVIHDLKNPVNAMDLHAQVLLRSGRLSTEDHQSVTQIRAQARQLVRMIMNLLDISKAEEGKLSPAHAEVDLPALCGAVLAEFEVTAKARGVKLEAGVPAWTVRADEDLLRRTVANLVENAIRHAPPGTTVTARGTPSAGEMQLRVEDAGPGVPRELREKIFEAFTQTDTRSTSRGGRGLGLTFCRLAIEAHGGRIWIEDGAPGAVFCVSLPNAPRA